MAVRAATIRIDGRERQRRAFLLAGRRERTPLRVGGEERHVRSNGGRCGCDASRQVESRN